MGRGGHRDGGPDAPIEFLPPDSHAFATSSADGFVDVGADTREEFGDEPRSPWVTFATAAAVIALFTVGLVAASPWSSDEQAAQRSETTTTTAPTETTTPDATPTTVLTIDDASPPEPDTGYLAAGAPAGFEISGLYTSSAQHDVVWLELWATARSSRLRGSWFVVQIDPQSSMPVGSGAERVDIGRNGIGLLTHTSDGIAVLSFALSHGAGAVITAGGWTDDALATLAAGMGHVGVRPVFGDVATGEHELLWSGLAVGRSVDDAYAYGDVRAALRYERRSDDTFISIVAAPSGGSAEVLSKYVLGEDPEFPLSGPSIRIGINGRQLTAGVLPGLDGARVARWVENGEFVTVLSDLPLADVLDVVATVHGATTDSWRDAMEEARGFRPDAPPNVPQDEIAGGVLDNGGEWHVALDSSGNFATVRTGGVRLTKELSPHDEQLYVVSTINATVVIARVPSTTAGSGLVLRVAEPQATADIALVPAGASGTAVAAAYALDQLGAFTASLLDADGTAVATLTRADTRVTSAG